MSTLLEHGGQVDLWGGWKVRLPSSYYETNPDGSWSSWGEDWTLDVDIVEIAGDSQGTPVPPEALLSQEGAINAKGEGWIGEVALNKEMDNSLEVFRLAARLAATNTCCWITVSYFADHQHPFAEDLVRAISHEAVPHV
ncbi:MAG: hypothetical protein V4631_13025 [Pseudomonadota bacterium]